MTVTDDPETNCGNNAAHDHRFFVLFIDVSPVMPCVILIVSCIDFPAFFLLACA